MAHSHGGHITTDGLVFIVDAMNTKSYNSGSAPNDVLSLYDPTVTGSLQNGVAYTNGAWDFDGTDDYIDFGVLPNTNFGTNDFTIDVWFKWDIATSFDTILNIGGYSLTVNGFVIYANTDKITMYRDNTGADVLIGETPTSTLTVGQWYNLIVVRSGTNIDVYINNVKYTITTGASYSLGNNVGSTRMGATDGNGGLFPFNGKISNVKIYNKVLTAQEIKNNFNTHRHRYGI